MQWIIHQIDQTYVDGTLIPVTAHWRCLHTEGEYSGTVYSTATLAGITALDIDSVLAHIWANGVNKESAENACRAQISDARMKASIAALQEMKTADVPDQKFVGVEFEGVMCSATKEDQAGLIAIFLAYTIQKSQFQPTEFVFSNGAKLTLKSNNIMQFVGVWLPFRQSFFAPGVQP